jgi:gas vesicle protein
LYKNTEGGLRMARKEMAKTETNGSKVGSLFSGILIGGAIGAVTALLMAPQSGQKTRQLIQDKSMEIRDKTNETIDETLARAERALADVQNRVNEVSGQAKKRVDEFSHRGQKELEEQRQRLEEVRTRS